ncbi:MAG: carboxypeptidase-like regulatory domain-containing protein [Planctomycetota bacterium]
MKNLLQTVIVMWVGVLCVGCGPRLDKWQLDRPELAKAAGTVTLNGQPLKEAVITFFPVTGSHSAFAKSDAKGSYVLTTFDPDDGAVAGDYKVTVSKLDIQYEADPVSPYTAPPLYHSEQSLVPDEFGDSQTTKLTASVPTSGSEAIDLALTGPEGKLKILTNRRGK